MNKKVADFSATFLFVVYADIFFEIFAKKKSADINVENENFISSHP